MSDDDNERDSGGALYENSFDLTSEWGPARLDRRHQFNGYAVFFCPTASTCRPGSGSSPAVPVDAAIGRDINGDSVNTRRNGVTDRPFSAPGLPFQRNAFRNEPFKDVNFRGQWGLALQRQRPRHLHRGRVQRVQLGQHRARRVGTVQNYCAGTAPDDCGFGPPTNPNFLSLAITDRDRRTA